ncbi:MAG TPA: nuclear transport factor 2 family protein [Polyangiaceae bacterium]|jgi:steroid delta-isomerase-like uncharacterized protein|nr:nuclear transport factor 2 family protein [Polyangiaceae bacterium]
MSNAKTIADRFWNLFKAGNFAELEALMHPECHFKMPGIELRDRAAVIQMLRAYITAFPDLTHDIVNFVGDDESVAEELVVTGTQTGPMQTPQGVVPPTGKRVVWESCDYIRVRQGKLTSWHVYHDPLPFLSALGLVKA